MSIRHLTSFLLLLVAALPAAHAQVASDSTVGLRDSIYALPAVTIRDSHVSSLQIGAAHVERIDSRAIQQSGAANVAELLSVRSSAFVKQYGSGGLATLSLRGASGKQTLLLIDGFRAADPQTGQVDVSLLPTVLLRSVDILHGSGAARFGSSAMGGVVQLHTLRPTTEENVRVRADMGAYGSRRLGVVLTGGTRSGAAHGAPAAGESIRSRETATGGDLSGSHGPAFSALFAAEAFMRQGDFPFINEALAGDPLQHRLGADRTTHTFYGSVALSDRHTQARVSAWKGSAERGLPGSASHPPSLARQWDDHLYLWGRLNRLFQAGRVTGTVSARRTSRRFVDPHAYGTQVIDDTARTQTYSASLEGRMSVSDAALIDAGIDVGLDETALHEGRRRLRAGAFAGGAFAVGPVSIYPALRLDAYRNARETQAAAAPRLGLQLQLGRAPDIALSARLARVFRMPTFGERYFEPGGNPDLRPERGWSGEFGAQLALDGLVWSAEANATLFASQLRDQIAWTPSFVSPGVQVWTPENRGRVMTRGGMLALRGTARLAPALHAGGGLTFSHTAVVNRTNPLARAYDRQLPYVPRQRLKWHAGIQWRAFQLNMFGRMIGARFITSDETQSEPPYQVLDVRLRYERRIGPLKFAVSAGIENLLDERYDIIRFYPMPPRHAEGGMTVDTGLK